MKIALSINGNDLDAPIDPRFGRCSSFIFVDPQTMEYEVCGNANGALSGGAGIQAAQFVASKQADVVITGNCGPNAVKTLAAAGVRLITGESGPVRGAVERFRQGLLTSTTEPNVSDHYGLGGGAPANPSWGMGGRGGRGGGGGMGCRRGGGGGGGGRMAAPSELQALGEDLRALRSQLEKLETRIKELGEN